MVKITNSDQTKTRDKSVAYAPENAAKEVFAGSGVGGMTAWAAEDATAIKAAKIILLINPTLGK